LNGDARRKPEQKAINNEIKELEEQLEAKHAQELADYDRKHPSTSKLPSNGLDAKIDFKSINLNFNHLKFNA
jgi:hypothetical protein